MNFYIFNSNKSKVLLSILTFVFLTIALDVALTVYVNSKWTSNVWLVEKFSKSIHMAKSNLKDIDYIFIGSSRTLYHISTSLFKENNKTVYNFGVSGRQIIDYPFMVGQAIKQKPKAIVISLPVYRLYEGTPLGSYSGVTFEDLKAIYRTQPFSIKKKAIFAFLKNNHSLLRYTNTIYVKLKKYYSKGNLTLFPDDKSIKPGEQKEEAKVSGKDTEQQNTKGKTSAELLKMAKKNSDCQIFDSSSRANNKFLVKCTNGDGILYGQYIPNEHKSMIEEESKDSNENLKNINIEALRLLNSVLDDISSAGIKSIIVLEPLHGDKRQYNLQDIENVVHSDKIVDFTNTEIDDEYWVDSGHFNNKGRLLYSQMLYEALNQD